MGLDPVGASPAMSEGHPERRRALLILLLALLAMSGAAIFARLADAPGVVVALWRMLIAAAILAPWTLAALRRTPLTRHNAPATIVAGVLLGIHFATWISALKLTTIAAAVTLVSTSPLWVTLMAWMLWRRAPTLGVLSGVLLAVAGGAVIAFWDVGGEGAQRALLGDGLALLGAIAMAGYLLLGRAAQHGGLSLSAYVGVAYSVAALTVLPLPAILGESYTDYPTAAFAWMALLAVVPQLVGHTGINHAMTRFNPVFVSTATLSEPIGAALLALLIFSEVPSGATIVGALIVLAGVFLTIRSGGLER
jgi:drug/metabolite transporter (DMT)-like permease